MSPSRRIAAALLLTVLALALATSARADGPDLVVHDGDAFSIDFASTSTCFMSPAALRLRAPCKGIDPSKADSLNLGEVAILAVALTPIDAHETNAVITLLRSPHPSGPPADLEQERALFEKNMQTNLGGPGTARSDEARLVHLGELSVLRVTTHVDDIPQDDVRANVLEYQGAAVFFDAADAYMLLVGGRNRDRAAIEALVDQLAATVKLRGPEKVAPPPREPLTWATIIGTGIGWSVVPLLALGALLWDRRRRARLLAIAAAEPPPPPRKRKKRRKPSA